MAQTLKLSYLEDTSAGHAKFYLLILHEDAGRYETSVHFGKIGSDGQQQSKYVGNSRFAAEAAYDKALADRQAPGKNYQSKPLPARWVGRMGQPAPSIPAPPRPVKLPITLAQPQQVDPLRFGRVAKDPAFAAQLWHGGEERALLWITPSIRPAMLLSATSGLDRGVVFPALLSALNSHNPIMRDTIYDAEILAGAPGPRLRLLDLARYRGIDLSSATLEERHTLLRQSLAELAGEGNLSPAWEQAALALGVEKQSLLAASRIGFPGRARLSLRNMAGKYGAPGSWLSALPHLG